MISIKISLSACPEGPLLTHLHRAELPALVVDTRKSSQLPFHIFQTLQQLSPKGGV